MTAALTRTFASLSLPNYRRFFAGHVVSVSGNWMQTVAEMWLIVQLTGSGVTVGLTVALQFAPMLLFGAWGGLLADRFAKRRLLQLTQAMMALPAIALWALTASGTVTVGLVYVLVFLRGSVNAIDNPARQSFVFELVGPDRLVNAVSLNSVIIHAGRIVGPGLAGIVIAVAGVAPCFALNALTFVVMIVALRAMDPRELRTPAPAPRQPGQLRAALRHVWATPELRIPLGMMALVGTLSFNFQVLLPLLASKTWHGGASTYAAMMVAMAAGSIVGALAAGARARVSSRLIVLAAAAFGIAEFLVAAAPTLPLQTALLVPTGAASVTFAAGVNSALQLAVSPALRGRVMALYAVVFLGSTAIGAPFIGWLAEAAGPRAGVLVGGIAALVAAGWALFAYRPAAISSVAPRRLRV